MLLIIILVLLYALKFSDVAFMENVSVVGQWLCLCRLPLV